MKINVFCLSLLVLLCVSPPVLGQRTQPKPKRLRFGENGEFKILQVADMHYADGKATPCENVLPAQFASCSDLNTTAFIRRLILAEKPDLIVFTGIYSPSWNYIFKLKAFWMKLKYVVNVNRG